MKYKLVAYDLDGTLINKNQEIAQSAIDAMKKLNDIGVMNVLTTGRSFFVIPNAIKECDYINYGVMTSGACIYDKTEQSLKYNSLISKEELVSMTELIHKYDGALLAFFNNGVVYETNVINKARQKIVDMKRKEGATNIYVCDDASETYGILHGLEKITFEYDSKYIKEIEKGLKKIGEYEAISLISPLSEDKNGKSLCITEINRKGISKGNGLRQLCKRLNINLEETIAFGDSENDLPLFEIVGYSVAMGNGSNKAKEKANFVTKDIDEDGIAFALNKIFDID